MVQLNELKRMQQLAGLITESQLNEGIKTIDANSRDFKVEGNEEINPADLKPGTMITKIRSYHDKDELESEAGKFEKVENDYIYWKTKDGQEKSWRAAYTADLALVKNLEMAESQQESIEQAVNEALRRYRKMLKEGQEVTSPDQLKKAVADSNGSYAICKINSEQSPAPELKKLNGQFGIIENSSGYNGTFYAESVRMCQPEGADSFFVTSNVNKLPAVKGVGGGNGCNFSYFELVAVVGDSPNPRKIFNDEEGRYVDNPKFDANAKDIRKIVKKY